ncbi:MAG: MarR family transcriptional regulator [Clostridia bacterium]|nr:MarR family transcriptional regulator [Clostridia bacterium]
MKNKEYLSQLATQEKQYAALYRAVGGKFGLPDCTMWALYYLVSSDEPLTQQDLIEKMMFPKQTINSAIMNLVKSGDVELQIVPGTRNRKTILLTEAGTKLANDTVKRMYEAELRAVEAMGTEKMEQFNNLYSEFFSALQSEFAKEGLADEN